MKRLISNPTPTQHNEFKRIFGWNLYTYWDATGFDVIWFDEAVKTPDGVSCRDHIAKVYGPESVHLIDKLIAHK